MVSVVKYAVSVHTGNKRNAGTDANVFVNIFGDQGDTGDRPLKKSSTNKNKFEKGNVRIPLCIFKIQGPSLKRTPFKKDANSWQQGP